MWKLISNNLLISNDIDEFVFRYSNPTTVNIPSVPEFLKRLPLDKKDRAELVRRFNAFRNFIIHVYNLETNGDITTTGNELPIRDIPSHSLLKRFSMEVLEHCVQKCPVKKIRTEGLEGRSQGYSVDFINKESAKINSESHSTL